MNRIIFICLISSCIHYGQIHKLYGTVKDFSNNQSLAYANVSVQQKLTGTTTDSNGNYELILAPGEYNLLFSYMGYRTEIISIVIETRDVRLDVSLVSTSVLLQEVAIYSANSGEDKSVSSMSMQSKEIKTISSVFPDVFRSIQALPGIAVNNEFSAKFNVRGGNYDENLVLVNNTQVYEPFHIKEVDIASIGIFNLDMMKKVNLITGGFSARYGDRLSSVLNIEYREGNRDNHSGAATLSLTNLDTYFEGPVLSNGSYILGLRKSYLEYAMSLLDVEENIKPSFYDIQGVLTYNISPADKIQFKFIHAGDDFIEEPNEDIFGPYRSSGTINKDYVNAVRKENNFSKSDANYYSNLFDLQYNLFFSGNILLNAAISFYEQLENEFGYDTYKYSLEAQGRNYYFYRSDVEDIYKNRLKIKSWEAQAKLDIRLNPFYDIQAGINYLQINYDQNLIDSRIRHINQNIEQYPDTISLKLEESDIESPQYIKAASHKYSGYIENILQIAENLILNMGGRLDYFELNKDLTLSPRISASYQISPETTLRAAWGHYYQSPIYRQLAYSFSSDTNTQSQKAEHFILSMERDFKLNDNNTFLTLKAEGYYKKYSDLISSTRSANGKISYSRKNDSKGYARGIDLFLALTAPGYYGWLSYGLLYAKEDLLTDNMGNFPRYTDQRHTISWVNDFDLGLNWDMNIRLTYGSGFAFTPYYSQYNPELRNYEWIEGQKNAAHLPAYKRVDVRISKEFMLLNFDSIIFLDINNLLNFKNIYAYRYRYNNNGYPVKEGVELWPVIPSIGLTVKF